MSDDSLITRWWTCLECRTSNVCHDSKGCTTTSKSSMKTKKSKRGKSVYSEDSYEFASDSEPENGDESEEQIYDEEDNGCTDQSDRDGDDESECDDDEMAPGDCLGSLWANMVSCQAMQLGRSTRTFTKKF